MTKKSIKNLDIDKNVHTFAFVRLTITFTFNIYQLQI